MKIQSAQSSPENSNLTTGASQRRRRLGVTLFAVSLLAIPIARADKNDDVQPKTEHLSALAAEKESRTPAQRKLSSHLLFAARKSRGEEAVKGIPTLNVSVELDDQGRADVEILGVVTPELLKQIEQHGGTVVGSFPVDNKVHALVPLKRIEKLAERPEVQFIRPTVKSQANNAGVQNDQADNAHAAIYGRWRDNVDGTGINIGTLSTGVNSLAQSQKTGDLPADLVVLPGQAGKADEGTAMMEHIHDLAPGAKLFYADGSAGGSSQMAANIRALAAPPYNCSIIVDDISYFNESPFQDSDVARAVNDVTAAGVLYFSSAANSGNKASNTASAWEGDFVDGGPTPAWSPDPSFGVKAGRVHNFGTASAPQLFNYNASNYNADSFISKKRTRVDLFWNDPLGKSGNDYDLVLTDDAGNVTDASTDVQDGTADPYEAIDKLNDAGTSGRRGTRIYVVLAKGAPRFLHLETPRDPLAFSTHGSTHGHNASGAANAFCVAAAPSAASEGDAATSDGKTTPEPAGPFPNSFTTSSKFEVFSSDGPRRIFYEADGTAITPGKFTGNDGRLLKKPDITAGDGADTTVTDFAPFFGTSAAAPHAAAIAALCRQRFPNSTAAQIRTALTSTALDLAPAGWDEDSGYGIVMPDPAIRSLGNLPPPYASFVGLPDTFFDNPDYTIVRPASNVASQINILFRVENAPSSGKVRVTTKDDTAKGGLAVGDGSDYQKIDQDFFFQTDSKGHVGLTIPVTIFGDSTNQPNKTFIVQMGAVTFDVGGTATPRFADSNAMVTLLNHNPPACSITVGDIRVTEARPTADIPDGTVDAEFPITLSNATDRPVTVTYATAAGTALETTDYTKTTGSITIKAGDTQASVIVPVVVTKQRNQPEATFSLVLSNPVNATLAKGTGVCTIDQPFTAGPPVNISTRLKVLGGDKLLISGFIVTGADTKQVLIRGLGPSLPVPGTLTDPALQLYDANANLLVQNDDWGQSQQAQQIQSSGFAPTDPRESAILATLPGNAAYTAVFGGKNGEQGVGLVEVYDFATHSNSGLANISTRGYVGTGDEVMIAGFIIGANSESGSARIIVRGSGPSIQGISDALQDPMLELHDSNGNIVATNNNWRDTQQAEIQFTTIPPANDLESAIVQTLNPDAYTAVLRGNNGTGVGIIEVYKLN